MTAWAESVSPHLAVSPLSWTDILEFPSSRMVFFLLSLQRLFPDPCNLQLILLVLITPD